MADDVSHAGVSRLTTAQFGAIAAFRYELRRFLAFSEQAAAEVGLPAQQHQALLAITGQAEKGPPSIGQLAELLLVAPHTAAELVARMVDGGLVVKTPCPLDRRRAELTLTARARTLLDRLTPAHVEELKTLEPALARALGKLSRARP
ncbi:MAG TPA: MarR family winged helix-turn-helix transcriptional regulator [Caulobacteraceae bacterium]|jgi:DNA-binding MarR family transcriptional regulator